MPNCPNCNEPLAEGVKFCDKYAAPAEQRVRCTACGFESSGEPSFCQNCGAGLVSNQELITPEPRQIVPAEPETAPNPEKKQKEWLKRLLIAAGCVVVLFGLGIGGYMLFGSSNAGAKGTMANYPFFYIKEGNIRYAPLKTLKAEKISNKAVTNIEDTSYLEVDITFSVRINDSATRILYPENMVKGNKGIDLYYRNLPGKANEEPIKIDSDIRSFINDSELTRVYYLKGEEGTLYVHDLKDKEKIDSDVKSFAILGNGTKVVYQTNDGTIYEKAIKKDKEKIDSDSQLQYASEDFSKIYYIKDGSLYLKARGRDKQKIDIDVNRVVLALDGTGEMYYTKRRSVEGKAIDYVNDDLKDADAAMIRPTMPTFPLYSDYGSWDAYYAALNTFSEQSDQYAADSAEYEEKESRDKLRKALKDQVISIDEDTLYYFNGKESTLVTEAYVSAQTYSTKKAVMIYRAYSRDEGSKGRLSEISDASDVEDAVKEARWQSDVYYALVKGASTKIEHTNGTNFEINKTETDFLFLDNYSSEKETGDLYSMKITNTGIEKATKIEDDVYKYFYTNRYGSIFYYKDVADDAGDLYYDKKRVDSDVYAGLLRYDDEDPMILYFTHWDKGKRVGTLNVSSGGKGEKISDDVSDFRIRNRNAIAFMKDYSNSSKKGDVYVYRGTDKIEKIDTGVYKIIYSTKRRVGAGYYF